MFFVFALVFLLALASVIYFALALSETPQDKGVKQKLIFSSVIAAIMGIVGISLVLPKKNKVISIAQMGKGIRIRRS